ncbi:hypothetical protein [Streptomyces sp. NBC_01198]|uniref:hypothetical protein n=1 Tax=Streptomyces sp. NBC_01198 TaxID=2903769 RepID=UPI002E0FDE06|nr:hypothetical protein OG702_01120 [Streptomyces sp. NBC_01198]
MSKNSPAKGHHGLAARGQGKLLYYHTQIPYTDQRRKDPLLPKRHQPHDHRRQSGHWVP